MPQSLETLSLATPAPHVLCITLNRPQAANAFNMRMAEEIVSVFKSLAEPDAREDFTDIRCVIITGAGARSFCAGADLKERNGMTMRNGSRSTPSSSACSFTSWIVLFR